MLLPGQVVPARVTRTEAYGIYLSCEDQTILVLVPEVSWDSPVNDCRAFAAVGDSFPTMILRFVPEKDLYLGSIRQANAERDPWANTSAYAIGSEWTGVVTGILSAADPGAVFGYLVELRPGVSGLLRRRDGIEVKVGDHIHVSIESVDPEARKLLLKQ